MENGLKIQFFIKGKHYAPPPTKKMAGGPVYFLCIKYRPPIEAIYAFFYNHEKKANLF